MIKQTLSCGILGLPNVGKSTLFNALLKKTQASASNFPFCTIDPNIGIIEVPDPRLNHLATISKSKKIIPATMTFVDIAGLVKGASKGEGLGNQFLANIRTTDTLIHVVRCFEEEEIIHVAGRVDPLADVETIEIELILADLQMIDNTLEKLSRQARGNQALIPTLNALKQVHTHLDQGHPLSSLSLTPEMSNLLKPYSFLTGKQMIYAANVDERSLTALSSNPHYQALADLAKKRNAPLIPISAKLEEELLALDPEEAADYLKDLNLKEPGLNRLIKLGFKTLGLITFLTTGEQETRAWTIKRGTSARAAAGKIHTDIERGFIRAEVIDYEDFIGFNGRVGAKEAGKVRLEGRDYIVADGNVILFFHN